MPADSPSRLHAPTLIAGLSGAGSVLALGLSAGADPGATITASLLLSGLTLFLARRPEPAIGENVAPPTVAIEPRQPRTAPFAAIIEGAADPILVVEAGEPGEITGHRVLFANTAARELFHIVLPDPRLVTAIRNPQVVELVDEALFGGIAGEASFEPGGVRDRVWIAAARPLETEPDRPPLALLVLRDQTDLRRVERMRADFLANASHELRTPLASLTGFIETLRGHARDDAAARDRFLAIMQAQAERMSRLIEDLMSLSRIELNEHIAPQGQADLAQAVTDVADALTPVLEKKAVRIDWTPPPRGSALVEGDRDQIIQVIQNLVDNAVKYSPAGGAVRVELVSPVSEGPPPARDADSARIALLTPDHSERERYALLRVTDQGPGMARESLPRLTERFFRVEGQKSGERLGTGLGLAIVKHVVQRHGGQVQIESVVGQGSTFTLGLPPARVREVVSDD